MTLDLKVALIAAIDEQVAASIKGAAFDLAVVGVYADWLEEHGDTNKQALAYALHWMVARGHRPGYRPGINLKKRWAWWMEEAERYGLDDKRDLSAQPFAVLDWLLLKSIRQKATDCRCCFTSWWLAVGGLADGLALMEKLLRLKK